MSLRLSKKQFEAHLRDTHHSVTGAVLTWKSKDVEGAPYHFRITCGTDLNSALINKSSSHENIYIISVTIPDAHDEDFIIQFNLEIDPVDLSETAHDFFFKIQDPSVQFETPADEKEFDLNVGGSAHVVSTNVSLELKK